MMKKARQKPSVPISRPEDKAWSEWFNKLKPEEHENFLSKLGLGKEDIDEWGEKGGAKQATSSVKRKD